MSVSVSRRFFKTKEFRGMIEAGVFQEVPGMPDVEIPVADLVS